MTKTSILINQNVNYNLRNYYNQSMPSWQKALLSRQLTNKLLNENTSLAEIFWVVMSQTNIWHAYSHFSPNPVIQALFQLPAAQACITMNKHGLLTQENCYIMLDAEQPEYVNAAILALSNKAILNEASLNLVLHHPMTSYAAQLLIIMHDYGIPSREAVNTFTSFDQCVKIIGINQETIRPQPVARSFLSVTISVGRGSLPPPLRAEDELARFYSILYACSQLTPVNMSLFEQSDVFIYSETYPKLTPQIKLGRLIFGMILLQEANLMGQDQFNHLLKNIQSDDFIKALSELRDAGLFNGAASLLTAINYEHVKQSSNIKQLCVGMHELNSFGRLTPNYFIDLVESTQPEHLASVITSIYVWHHRDFTPNPTQYEAIKNRLNLEQFSDCLKKLSGQAYNQDNISSLINYGDILFNKDGDNSFWKQIPHITQHHLDDIFLQCKKDRESNTTDRAECVKHVEDSIGKINRLLNHQKRNVKKQGGLQALLDDFGIMLPEPTINAPQTEEARIIDTIQKIILRRLDVPYSRILIAFHLDKTKTLRESFNKLNIGVDHVLPNERFIFSEDILNSEELFKKISASMIEFAQEEIKGPESKEEEKSRQTYLTF